MPSKVELEKLKGFDLDLKFGQHFEGVTQDILSGKTKVEVKTERDKWVKYGNMVIEKEYRGKPSGITRTESPVWVHNFTHKNELIFSLMVPTEILRKVVDRMEGTGVARVTHGGDGKKSKLTLVPIDLVLEYLRMETHNGED